MCSGLGQNLGKLKEKIEERKTVSTIAFDLWQRRTMTQEQWETSNSKN